ncbi:MAG TPA: hypothetical protein VF950_24780 [Planctomycetota bacterium]
MIRDVLRGALGFAAVSVAAFSVWAFGPLTGAAMYAGVAAVFVVLTGFALHRLAPSPVRFAKAFIPAFVAYAFVWSAIYFRFKGRDYLATVAAVAAFTAILAAALGGRRAWLHVWPVATALHAAGYWLGGVVCYGVFQHDRLGMLAWGVGYGLGFGAGIGYAFHVFQRRALPTAA